jgi:hypothetical protein
VSDRLKLKQEWTIEEINIFSNSRHLEWRAGLSDTILKWDYPRTIPDKFALIWCFNLSQNELNYCSYIARSSLTYIPGFSVKFFFQPIYTDYAN